MRDQRARTRMTRVKIPLRRVAGLARRGWRATVRVLARLTAAKEKR